VSRSRTASAAAALGGLLVSGLALRLWSIRHGLPFVYSYDEQRHFVPVAVKTIGGSLNPGYFENPPALAYLLSAVFRVRFTAGFPFGSSGLSHMFRTDPEAIYLTARVTVALIGTAVAGLAYWAGARFFNRRVGLVAAALMALAFLPVFYSKFALNDVVTLVPLTLALVACLLVYERGRPLDFALAGVALGVATATKYTAGAMTLTLVLAAALRVVEGRENARRALLLLAGTGALFALAFVALNPYSLLDFHEFRRQLGGQSAKAGGLEKIGQVHEPGWIYYARTLTWGFGWAPVAAALAGAILAFRSDWRRTALLLVFPLVLLLFLGSQARYFARWLLPAYPALSILAGYAVVRAADALAARPARRAAVVLALSVLLAAQGFVESVRVDRVLARTDTRDLARDWLAAHVPAHARIVVEPFLPLGFLSYRERPRHYYRWPITGALETYEKRVTPRLVDLYRRGGYCWVVTGSYQRDRGLKEGLAGARAYYSRLDRESSVAQEFSPYDPDATPVKFSFEYSFDYLPRAFARPGPVVVVRRLEGCTQRYGREGRTGTAAG
jgi:dolichyl-phosphate-mannose-protein mannosyltransferase